MFQVMKTQWEPTGQRGGPGGTGRRNRMCEAWSPGVTEDSQAREAGGSHQGELGSGDLNLFWSH